VSVSAEGGQIVLCVRDHGIGIPSKDLERVFERFYRVDRARSRATGGTGLGLSIVRHVAEAHGGDVTVQSTEGEGSKFLLTLPLADAASHVAEAS
jgi:two-component system sensor histidine kinase SenX3